MADHDQHSDDTTIDGDPVHPTRPPGSPSGPVAYLASTDPQVIGPYRIEGAVGAGGMGVVYRGHDPILDRTVAIKIPNQTPTENPRLHERFLTEARALARVAHPNVVAIYSAGEDAGTPYFAMEFIEGQTVAQRLADSGAVPVLEALGIVRQAAQGLRAALASGIIHRDVKPANLLVDRNGVLRLMDFGLAKRMEAGQRPTAGVVMGTPGYMSPEQGRGLPPDHRSDIYSLGASLYCMLAGRAPFTGSSAREIIHQSLVGPQPEIESEEVPPQVHRLVDRMMERDVGARLADYDQLIALIDEAIVTVHQNRPLSPEQLQYIHTRFGRYCWQLLTVPRVMISEAVLSASGGEAETFMFRIALTSLSLRMLTLLPSHFPGIGPGLALSIAWKQVLFCIAVVILTAVADLLVARIGRIPVSFRRLLAGESFGSPYLLLFAPFPGQAAILPVRLLGLVYMLRIRQAMLDRALGLTRWAALLAAALTSAMGIGVTAAVGLFVP